MYGEGTRTPHSYGAPALHSLVSEPQNPIKPNEPNAPNATQCIGHLLAVTANYPGKQWINIYPLYRKPFDLIFARAKNEVWRAREDLNLQPLAPEASALSN
jgi:hypothetical protein